MNPTPWQKKLPLWITLSRIISVFPIVLLLSVGKVSFHLAAALFFIIASITDYYDGYYARKFNAISNLGKFLDPIADKVLVTSVLVMLSAQQKIDPYMVMIILARDTIISGIRSVAAADNVVIDAKPTGKWKTALQMIAIPCVMIGEYAFGIPFDKIGNVVLWVSVILSVVSGVQYYLIYLRSRKNASS